MTKKDTEDELLAWVEDLESENEQLRAENQREAFIANSVVTEFRQKLTDTEFELAKARALLKLLQQPTA